MNSKTDVEVIISPGLPPKNTAEATSVKFDTALTLAGFGKFQYLIILLCGTIYCCVGFQNGLNAFVMPSAQCDLELDSGEKGLLNAAFLGGGLASSFFWGILADQIGRKKVLVYTLLLDSALTLISSFSQSFLFFLTFRFLNGFLIGGAGSVLLPYLGEFLDHSHRASGLCAIGFFWTLSWLILPAAAWAVLPITWFYKHNSFLYNSWRIFVAMFTLPSLISGIVLALFFPESPKFLFSQGRQNECLKVLQFMYRVTNGKTREYPVKVLVQDEKGIAPKPVFNNVEKTNKKSKISMYYVMKEVWNQILFLCRYPMVYSTLLASFLMFSNMFGYYGLGLWFPELFNRFEDHYKKSNLTVSVCELTQMPKEELALFPTLGNLTTPIKDEDECSETKINSTVFINTFIIGVSCLVGNVVTVILAKKFALKILITVTALVSGLCTIAIYFLKTQNQILIISCAFITFVGSGNSVVTSGIVDLFPTNVRLFEGRVTKSNMCHMFYKLRIEFWYSYTPSVCLILSLTLAVCLEVFDSWRAAEDSDIKSFITGGFSHSSTIVLKALAVCTAIFAGRLGAVASNLTLGYVLDISCNIPIFLMGAVLLGGSIMGFFVQTPTDVTNEKDNT